MARHVWSSPAAWTTWRRCCVTRAATAWPCCPGAAARSSIGAGRRAVPQSGGKVVKNVAGYDLPKLATGSLGTLAVITQAVFRLHPLPHETRTLTFAAPDVEPLCELALAIQGSQLAFVSLQVRAGGSVEPGLDVAFEGARAGLDSQQDELLRLAASVTRVDPPASVWRGPGAAGVGAGAAARGGVAAGA